MNFLAENVRQFLKANYISREEFAKRANVSLSTVQNIALERKYAPREETLRQISEAMNVSVESLTSKKIQFDTPKIGENIKELCRLNNISLSELARQSGVSENTICGIAKGNHRPRQMTLECVAEAFGLTVKELLEYRVA